MLAWRAHQYLNRTRKRRWSIQWNVDTSMELFELVYFQVTWLSLQFLVHVYTSHPIQYKAAGDS